ncbi:endopeptidase La [Dermatobacter hominis]|uniref:endopeptidase La n=1 Tax=Dermatobacter hominis TaxID=2884263 RepID=UPI0035ABDC2B
MVVTIALETDEARAAARAAAGDGVHDRAQVLLVPRLDGRYAAVGTVAQIEDAGELRGGVKALVVRGLHRAVIGAGVPGTGEALWVRATPAVEANADTDRAEELAKEYQAVVENILESRGVPGLADAFRGMTDPGAIADMAGYSPDLSAEQKVGVLEALDVEDRLELVVGWARETLADLSLKDRIRKDVTEGMEKTQREFLLRQQLAAIQKELGEESGDDEALDHVRALAADPAVPQEVRDALTKELGRLERTSEQSPEHGWIRTWLDTVAGLPWTSRAEDPVDVPGARAVLDADHNGLEDVKDRIVEHLAVRARLAERAAAQAADGDDAEPAGRSGPGGAIITLVGPPGVGKTSLGESVARAMGRPFVRVALGGVRDEAEIRGHRRTYVGAMPGRIARAISDAGVMNPVLMLDEVDKLGSDWRGDPSSALLEVLDPAQNHTFRDHYLEVDLDLSDVVFIATANVMDTIPGPLLDRMEVVPLDGYTEAEKVDIARDHLVARQRRRNGVGDDEVTISDDALRSIVADHTREAGVRNLERQVGRLLRKVATALSTGAVEAPVEVRDADDVRRWLGRPRFFAEVADRTSVPGVATGLAVTGVGGDVLFVEASSMPSSGDAGLTLTGQLGDVMKESGTIALSYVRAHADELGVADGAFDDRRFHLHVPAGAVPKDGPSAGVTMVTAMTSLLTGRPVRSTVGMTGEVTLQGNVLPIGGVKQKVLAAHRAGLTEVVLPARNGPDLDDVPEAVREQMTFHLASHIDEVLAAALEPASDPVAA